MSKKVACDQCKQRTANQWKLYSSMQKIKEMEKILKEYPDNCTEKTKIQIQKENFHESKTKE